MSCSVGGMCLRPPCEPPLAHGLAINQHPGMGLGTHGGVVREAGVRFKL